MLFFEVKAFFGEKAIIGKRLYRRMSLAKLIFFRERNKIWDFHLTPS